MITIIEILIKNLVESGKKTRGKKREKIKEIIEILYHAHNKLTRLKL